MHLTGFLLPTPVHLTQQTHAQGYIDTPLIGIIGVTSIQLITPLHDPTQILSKGFEFVVGKKSHGPQVEADDGGDVGMEECAGMQDDAIPTQAYDKINHLGSVCVVV